MIMDGSKEQTLGKFCKTCQDASIHFKQTEPHSPWQNAAEGGIKVLKKASGRKMVRAGASKPFWADATEVGSFTTIQHCMGYLQVPGQDSVTVFSGGCIFYLYGLDLYRHHIWVLDNPVSR
jgi:hypothetical protein